MYPVVAGEARRDASRARYEPERPPQRGTMPENSQDLHEDRAHLPAAVLDRHRAIASIMEELEAVDWYDQRVHAATDPALRGLLAHNRDEEKEHAAMMIEWLRRNDPRLDAELRQYLFTNGDLVASEAEAMGHDQPPSSAAASPHAPPAAAQPEDGSLGIGSLLETP